MEAFGSVAMTLRHMFIVWSRLENSKMGSLKWTLAEYRCARSPIRLLERASKNWLTTLSGGRFIRSIPSVMPCPRTLAAAEEDSVRPDFPGAVAFERPATRVPGRGAPVLIGMSGVSDRYHRKIND